MQRRKEGKRERGKAEFSLCENSKCLINTTNYSLKKPSFPPSLLLSIKTKSCFKLICGAGNENLQEVERLVALYSAAGCRFFDLAASEEVLVAAQRGLDFSIPKEQQKDYHFCVSIGTKRDQHVQKAGVNAQKCLNCGKCIDVCPQKAINQYFKVVKEKCIGCLACKNVCKHDAIEVYSQNKLIDLSTYKLINLSCIELHASDTDEAEVDEIWDYLNENFNGMLSLCIGRKKLSDEKILARVRRIVERRKPYTTIIQADGVPMSGVADDYETTLPAIEMGKLIQSLHLPLYLMLSGGTNSKTAKLAKQYGVNINGIAMGSYARKIVKEYIEREDFYENKAIFNASLKIAQNLINSVS